MCFNPTDAKPKSPWRRHTGSPADLLRLDQGETEAQLPKTRREHRSIAGGLHSDRLR